jgi:hypothetical protein
MINEYIYNPKMFVIVSFDKIETAFRKLYLIIRLIQFLCASVRSYSCGIDY